MAKRTYNLVVKTSNSTLRDYSIPVDESSEIEAKRVLLGDILRTEAVSGQGVDSIGFEAVTPEALLKTTASTTQIGLSKTSTNAIAEAGTNTNDYLVPSNLDAIFAARFKKTKTYVAGDVDIVASNISSITITDFSEMVVGNYTDMGGEVEVVVSVSEVPNIEIVIDSTQTPLHIKGCAAALLSASSRWVAQAGTIITSGGKLKIIIGNNDNTSFPAGTYKFSLGLNYYSE